MKIEPLFVERPWGRFDLAPLYGVHEKRIGEVWFRRGEGFPILVKFIFTAKPLSIQVHPHDEYAAARENCCGKTEMWHVLRTEPGASIVLGFQSAVTREQVRNAVEAGTISKLLNEVTVRPGDTLHAPAGTVHAIGAGIVLCEIQQDSDVTYRLYDYGSGRELHLEKALEVLDLSPYDGRRTLPVICDHFVTDEIGDAAPCESSLTCDYLLIGLAGRARAGDETIAAGEVTFVPAGTGPIAIRPEPGARLLRTRCEPKR